jgi:hypothetical protein
MEDEIEFYNDWFYFKEDYKRKHRKKSDEEIAHIKLPCNPLELRFVWFPQYDSSSILADIVMATLYHIKDEWQFFLKMYLKKRLRNVVVFCDSEGHAKTRGFDENFDFEEMPLWCDSWLRESTEGANKKQQMLIIKLVLADRYDDCIPEKLAESSIACINIALLSEFGSVLDPVQPAKMFWGTVSREVKKVYR